MLQNKQKSYNIRIRHNNKKMKKREYPSRCNNNTIISVTKREVSIKSNMKRNKLKVKRINNKSKIKTKT